MDVQQAVDNFDLALKHCDNIVGVHRAHGGPARGRRVQEVSLDRAVIVLAVAAWQAAVQDLTTALLDTAKPTGPTSLDVARYNVLTGPVRKAIGDFATPNASNTRKLMLSAGFDPRPHWKWVAAGGRGRQLVSWNPTHVDARLDDWLKVRHALAHGHESLPVVQALLAVRVKGVTSDPALRLDDAEACVRFLNRLVSLTAAAIATELGAPLSYPRR